MTYVLEVEGGGGGGGGGGGFFLAVAGVTTIAAITSPVTNDKLRIFILLVSGRRDAFVAGRQPRDDAELRQRPVVLDAKLVDGSAAGLGVEEAALARRGEVDRARFGRRRDRLEQRRLSALERERAERVAPRVGHVEEPVDALDPAQRDLAVALRLRARQRAVALDAIRRDRARAGLSAHEPPVRERERERNRGRGRIGDERRRQAAVVLHLEDVDLAA